MITLSNNKLISMIVSEARYDIKEGQNCGDNFRIRDFYEANKDKYDFSEITVEDEVLESIYRAEF